MHTSININEEFLKLKLLKNRTPHSTLEEKASSFVDLSSYRDGAIYIGYFSGTSDWERHGSADEIVYVLEGKTKLFIMKDGKESSFELSSGGLIVVPKDAWHRFETDGPIKSLTVTPMPTDHSTTHP
ncbi:cupin domain-containing protein [Candidatus Kaiserbacteria bacterium]|nr:cupin domain-containing protein [Candidatus Kaiserbacteria bacterium]